MNDADNSVPPRRAPRPAHGPLEGGDDTEASFNGVVSGRVQGVGFRAFVVGSAESLGLTGWVRNLHDGRVEVAARGPKRQLTVLAMLLHSGPHGAEVKNVDLDWTQGPGETRGFELRR